MSERLNAPWLEYWDFLNAYCNLKTIDGLKLLEIYLAQRKLFTLTGYQLNVLNYLTEIYKTDPRITVAIECLRDLLSVQVHSCFDWKENVLSARFKDYKLNGNDDSDDVLGFLGDYLRSVCELTKLDGTGRAYFNLYKVSRLYSNLISKKEDFFGLNDHYQSVLLRKLSDERLPTGNKDANSECDLAIKELNDNEKFFSKQDVDDIEFLSFKFSNLTISGEFLAMRRSFRSMSLQNKGESLNHGSNSLRVRACVKTISFKLNSLVIHGLVFCPLTAAYSPKTQSQLFL